jgi:hypothetical protein
VDLTHSFFGKQGGYTIDFKFVTGHMIPRFSFHARYSFSNMNSRAMSQLKKSTGYTRNVRRAVQVPTGPATTKKRRATTSPPPSTNVTWEWENDSNGFTAYDTATSDIIETAYIADPTQTIELTHSFFGKQGGYTIDLQAMTQTKKATGYVRQLRRVDPSGTTTGGTFRFSSVWQPMAYAPLFACRSQAGHQETKDPSRLSSSSNKSNHQHAASCCGEYQPAHDHRCFTSDSHSGSFGRTCMGVSGRIQLGGL